MTSERQNTLHKGNGRIVYVLLFLFVLMLAVGTIIERVFGTPVAFRLVYHSPWFLLLWALIIAGGIRAFVRNGWKQPRGSILIHLSLVVISIGALITFFTARRGYLMAKEGEEVASYRPKDSEGVREEEQELPFRIRVESLRTDFYPGTTTPRDYIAEVLFSPKEANNSGTKAHISMNKVGRYMGYRVFQYRMDKDHGEVVFMLSYDPIGTAVSYIGYLIFAVGFGLLFLEPKSRFRSALARAMGLFVLPLLLFSCSSPNKDHAKDEVRSAADRVLVSYDGRIAPLSSMSEALTLKVTGERHPRGITTETFALSVLCDFDAFKKAPLIKVKSRALRDELKLGERVSLLSLFPGRGRYLLQDLLERHDRGEVNELTKGAVELDEKVRILFGIHTGELLKCFPIKTDRSIIWVSPDDPLPTTIPAEQRAFVTGYFDILKSKTPEERGTTLRFLESYQKREAGTTYPSRVVLGADRLYHRLTPEPYVAILIFVLAFSLVIKSPLRKDRVYGILAAVIPLLLVGGIFTLRSIILGRLSLGTGFDTMLTLSFLLLFLALIPHKLRSKTLPLLLFASGVFLFVAFLSTSDPRITPLMPVLMSPILSLHVGVIMLSYALFTVVTILAGYGLVVQKEETRLQMADLAFVLLYPALWLLGIGVFVGAYWANLSWGAYWSWDPKEVWALITLLSYALMIHPKVINYRIASRRWLIILVALYLVMLMTYFGVNYLLGGMHAYA